MIHFVSSTYLRACLVIAILLGCVISPITAIAQPDAKQVVFRKAISASQTLVVTRREVPDVPPTKKEVEELQRKAPGAAYVTPDHVWVYSMQLQSKMRSDSKLLWTATIPEYKGSPWGSFKILDAYYNGEFAVVVQQDSRFIEAEITRKNNNFAVAKRTPSSVAAQELPSQPLSSQEPSVTSAKITVSKSPQVITVTLSDSADKKRRFIWQNKLNKWVEQKQAKPAPSASPRRQSPQPVRRSAS